MSLGFDALQHACLEKCPRNLPQASKGFLARCSLSWLLTNGALQGMGLDFLSKAGGTADPLLITIVAYIIFDVR